MKYEISLELLQSIVNYLENKPHREVRALIDEIAKCKPIEKEEKQC